MLIEKKFIHSDSFKAVFTKKNKSAGLLENAELNVIYFDRKTEQTELYTNFDEYINTYISKFSSSSFVREGVETLISKKKLLIGFVTNANKIPIFSSVMLVDNNTKLGNIVLIADDIGFNIKTREFEKVNDAIYATYLGIIKGICIMFNSDIIKDNRVESIVTEFMKSNIGRIIKHYVSLDTKMKEDLFEFSISYFIKRFYFNKRYALAKEEALEKLENKDDVEKLLKKIDFDRYLEFKSLFSFLIDVKISFTDTNTLLKVFISGAGLFSYIHMSSDYIFYVIPFIILSKYNFSAIKNIYNYNIDIIDELENLVVKTYINKIKYEN